MKTELCEIMTKYGSDKGTGWHNYTIHYHEKFKNLRDKPLKIFELGLGTTNPNLVSHMDSKFKSGGSLRGWKEYFPNAEVFGADIDTDILFEDDRIKTFFCDQRDSNVIAAMWSNDDLKNEKFDIILDDGLHDFGANIHFFENSFHKLKEGGIYIIEDILQGSLHAFSHKLQELSSKLGFSFTIFQINNPENSIDNNIAYIVKNN